MDIFSKRSSRSALPILPGAPPPVLPGSPIPKMPSGAPPIIPNVSLSYIRFTETADYEKGFGVYFEEKIKPVIKELEQERLMSEEEIKRITPKAIAIHVIGTILSLVVTILAKNAAFLIFGALISYIIRVAMLSAPKNKVRGKYKEKIVPLVVRFFGNFNYGPHETPQEASLRASGLFDSFNRVYGDDYIEGNHKGTGFRFSEVHLSRSGNKSSVTIFNGMIITMDAKKASAGQTIVRRESQKGLWASMTGKFKGMQKIPVDNPGFEKLFEVYSTDPNEAMMLVTPDFVARLMRLNDAYPNNMVRCCFLGGKLMLAINYGPAQVTGKTMIADMTLGYGGSNPGQLFEAGAMQKSLTDVEDIHKFLGQMHSILQIVETICPPKAEF